MELLEDLNEEVNPVTGEGMVGLKKKNDEQSSGFTNDPNFKHISLREMCVKDGPGDKDATKELHGAKFSDKCIKKGTPGKALIFVRKLVVFLLLDYLKIFSP